MNGTTDSGVWMYISDEVADFKRYYRPGVVSVICGEMPSLRCLSGDDGCLPGRLNRKRFLTGCVENREC
jgi:hypothetical protein